MKLMPLSPRFGVEVLDIDLRAQRSDDEVMSLRSALDDHKLLVVRGQAVDSDAHRAFARLFGFSIAELDGSDERSVTNRRTLGAQSLAFHTDHIYTARGSSPALSLYALEVPPGGTSTVFADTVLALRTLPSDVRDRIEYRNGWNVFSQVEHRPIRRNPGMPYNPGFRSLHPLVETHPRTGDRLLAVSDLHTERVDGLSQAESCELLEQLCAHIAKPAHCVEHHWQVDDVMVWDNIALQHARGANDPADGPRVLRRFVLDDRSIRDLVPESSLARMD
jgi:taurine dioxygenase